MVPDLSISLDTPLHRYNSPRAEEGDLRMHRPKRVRNWRQGRLQIFSGGAWRRAACVTEFTSREAAVACRQLGHGTAGTVALSGFDDGFLLEQGGRAPDRPIEAVPPVGCSGSETRLADCNGTVDESNRRSFCEGDLVLACVEQEEPGVFVNDDQWLLPAQSVVQALS